MTGPIDRRDFVKQASCVAGGLMAGSVLCGGEAVTENPDITGKRLVLLGLNALARAWRFDYFADGHRGAALISAHCLCADNALDDETAARIVEICDKNWSSTPLCESFPDGEADESGLSRIGEALAEGGETLRQVGHNAIFAMLAIKGFRLLPQAATVERVEGVCRMIRAFQPWRDVDPDEDVQPPPFSDAGEAARFVLREALAAVDRFRGYGQGFAGHMLTFGQALIELAATGDVRWAESCRTAFRKYVTVTRRGPDADARRIPDHPPSKLRPNQAVYWKNRGDRSVGLGHVFKYPYAYYDLLRRAEDAQLAAAWEEKAHEIF
ncbi:twin-arginine translocation signal domain-containing protein [Thermopirellula anaerolimosa]